MKQSESYCPKDPLLTAKQAAAELGIGRSTFWRDVGVGHLPRPYYVAPRAPRWLLSEIRAILASCPRHAGDTGGRAHGAAIAANPQSK